MERGRITIAILALGGQGGGVLTDWLVRLGEANGYFVQATSVPGVAQRTGSTIYYLEYFPEAALEGRQPALALMPAPGDVDIVLASELMEAGRAILRGFVTPDRTALISSTHRIYAISEKSAPGMAVADGTKALDAARRSSKSFVAFDMDSACARTGSAISAVMFGALAASAALDFPVEAFESAIRAGGVAVSANLAGFRAGIEGARQKAGPPETSTAPGPEPTTTTGKKLRDKAAAFLPAPALPIALEGVRRLMDYQDASYAELYLDRLSEIMAMDEAATDWALTREVARGLAVWMSYEDVMRVAQQKIRAARMASVRREICVEPDQYFHITEFMHPRWQELRDWLPARLGARLEANKRLQRLAGKVLGNGRKVRTTSIFSFLTLAALASHRGNRRSTLRYRRENASIESWLSELAGAAKFDYALAVELARCQNVIKGYGETHERSMRKFDLLMAASKRLRGTPGAAAKLNSLRQAAMQEADETGLRNAAAAIA